MYGIYEGPRGSLLLPRKSKVRALLLLVMIVNCRNASRVFRINRVPLVRAK